MRPRDGTAPAGMKALRSALLEAVLPAVRGRGRRRGGAAGPGGAADEARLGSREWRRIGQEVLRLHEAYTGRAVPFAHDRNPIHENAAGYQLYFLPRNFLRTCTVLEALPWADEGSDPLAPWCVEEDGERVLRVLDLGCGTGAFGLAVLSRLVSLRRREVALPAVTLTLVDQGRRLLELARANLEGFASRALPDTTLRLEVHADGVERYLERPRGGGGHAVVGSAMMLNELDILGPRRVAGRAAHLAAALRELARPGGLVMLVEPGTRKGYMNLMALREHLRDLPILYPCPHNEPCPMWEPRVRQWCHASRAVPPEFFFDEALRTRGAVGFEMKRLNLAGLAVQVTAGGRVAPPFRARQGVRIVSDAMPPARGQGARKPSRDPSARPGRVVLECAPDGKLHERDARGLGPQPRGAWVPGGRTRGEGP